MTDDFVDPGEPGALTSTRLRTKDLINKPLIIRPRAVRYDGKGKDKEGNPESYTYVNCDVWVLDRAGVVEHDTDVQFSWVRVIPQLEDRIDQFVAGTPTVMEDNSRVLKPFGEKGKEIARKVIADIKAEADEIRGGSAPVDDEPPYDDTEPF